MIKAEVNKPLEPRVIRRVTCEDYREFIKFLREEGLVNHPMTVGTEDGMWVAEIYEKP